MACNKTGWQLVDKGATLGGCKIYLAGEPPYYGDERCTHPGERFESTMEVLRDDTLLVYGGYSHKCVDYCDDYWVFNLKTLKWIQVSLLISVISIPLNFPLHRTHRISINV